MEPALFYRRFPSAWRTFALFTGLLALWLGLKPAPPLLHKVVDNLAQALGPLLMALWVGRRVRQTSLASAHQRALLLILLGAGGFGLGQLFWLVIENVLKQKPFPSVADAIWIPTLLAMLAGLLLLPTGSVTRTARGRVAFDALVMLASLVTFSWYYVLGPSVIEGTQSLLGKIVGLTYPIVDLLLVFCVLLLGLQSGMHRLHRPTLLLATGLSVVVVTDTLFTYQSLHGAYITGGWLDLGWPVGWMLTALSVDALRQAELQVTPAPSRQESRQAFWRLLVPYLLLPAVGVLVIYTARTPGDERLEPGIFVGGLVTITLVVLRQLAALVENRALYEQVLEANARLAALATTDGMTGLANHRTFQEHLRQELVRSQLYQHTCALILFDVDHFKSFNDQFGHPAGDQVLCAIAELVTASVGERGLVARYGGEEFAVLLPELALPAAATLAEGVRQRIAEHSFPHRAVTVSLGVACFPSDANDAEGLILAADQALYHAKAQGRNTVAQAADIYSFRTLTTA